MESEQHLDQSFSVNTLSSHSLFNPIDGFNTVFGSAEPVADASGGCPVSAPAHSSTSFAGALEWCMRLDSLGSPCISVTGFSAS